MIKKRPAAERGRTRADWLDSRHTFSFNRYYDPRWSGFRDLLVINEDFVAPSRGFGAHSHRDMEIISYVLDGALAHKDSMGTSSIIRPGEVQRMSAGTGVTHSEYNAAPGETSHFLQIWILPEREGIEPGYEQKEFGREESRGRLRLLASRDGREGSVTIHQDAELYLATLAPGEETEHTLRNGRHAWLQVLKGTVNVNAAHALAAGDGAAVSDEERLTIRAEDDAEVMLFDLK
ncbi:MAG TPA: pirin family protein [Pyrinomonadaceae bacterium]|nr:pirin family protein [Pyrinomonadaceae bacterium]